jgi:hypothetical protein
MIRSLKRHSADNATASTEHVRRWSLPQVEQEWTAYREASRRLRTRMNQAIRSEQRLLFPLMARYEQH